MSHSRIQHKEIQPFASNQVAVEDRDPALCLHSFETHCFATVKLSIVRHLFKTCKDQKKRQQYMWSATSGGVIGMISPIGMRQPGTKENESCFKLYCQVAHFKRIQCSFQELKKHGHMLPYFRNIMAAFPMSVNEISSHFLNQQEDLLAYGRNQNNNRVVAPRIACTVVLSKVSIDKEAVTLMSYATHCKVMFWQWLPFQDYLV